nr:hypothetical protein [Streptomyces griseocarneus]
MTDTGPPPSVVHAEERFGAGVAATERQLGERADFDQLGGS